MIGGMGNLPTWSVALPVMEEITDCTPALAESI